MQIKKGLWSPEEDDRLRRSIAKYVNGSWNDIARKAGLERCGRSCRQRWLNHLRPGLRKEKFSRDEVRQVIELQSKLGNRWSEIAAQLKGRTDNEVKNLWNTVLKRRLCLKKAPHQPCYSQRCSPAFHGHDPLPVISADSPSPSPTSSSSQSASSSHSPSCCSLSRSAPASASTLAHAMTFLDEDLYSLNVPASCEQQLLMTCNGPDHLAVMISPVDGLTCAVQKGQDCLDVDQDATSHGSSTQTPEISPASTRSEDIGVAQLMMREKTPCRQPASSPDSFELYGSLPNYSLHVANYNDVVDHGHSAQADRLGQYSPSLISAETLEIDPHYWDSAVRFVDGDANARAPAYCVSLPNQLQHIIRTSLLPLEGLQAAADIDIPTSTANPFNSTTYMDFHTTPILAHKPTAPTFKVAQILTASGASLPALAPPHKIGSAQNYLRSSLFPQQAAPTHLQIDEEDYSQYSPTLCLANCDGDPSYALSSDSDYTINAYDTFAATSPFLQTASSSDDHRRSEYTGALPDGIASMSVLWNEGC